MVKFWITAAQPMIDFMAASAMAPPHAPIPNAAQLANFVRPIYMDAAVGPMGRAIINGFASIMFVNLTQAMTGLRG